MSDTSYRTVPLESLTVRELTDALGLAATAELFGCSVRAIYTMRCTKVISLDRQMKLLEAVRKDETRCRERLHIVQQRQTVKAERRAQRDTVV
jgi:hypothetical protein